MSVLQQEIKVLKAVSGTDDLIAQKQDQINRLRAQDSDTPAWLIVSTLQSQSFWLQDDEVLNDIMHLIVNRAEIALGAAIDDARSPLSISRQTRLKRPTGRSAADPDSGDPAPVRGDGDAAAKIDAALSAIGCHRCG